MTNATNTEERTYRYEELDWRAQEKVRQRFGEAETMDFADWNAPDLIDWWQEDVLQPRGMEIDTSQTRHGYRGAVTWAIDRYRGAGFDGWVDLIAFLRHHKKANEYRSAYYWMCKGDVESSVRVRLNSGNWDYGCHVEPDPEAFAYRFGWMPHDLCEEQYRKILEFVNEDLQEVASKLTTILEKEWDWPWSHEYAVERCRDEDLRFDEQGNPLS